MKKVCLVAVGKIKESYLRDGIAEYSKRLSRFCDFEVKECEESPRQDVESEGKALLSAMDGAYNILTDRGGEDVSSERLAVIVNDAFLKSDRVNFIIGSSRGVSVKVRDKADKVISFGSATYPHMLFRLILSEQIYRAFTINAGLPYHK